MKSFMMPVIGRCDRRCRLGIGRCRQRGSVGPTTTSQTVSNLQAQVFHVILNKVGTAPLENCVVSAVRPGQTYSRMDSGAPGAMNDIVTTVTAKTVYVDVEC